MRTSRENREHARRTARRARRCRRLLGGERLESRLALATDFAAVPLWNGEATFPEAFDNGQVNTQSPGMLLNLLGGPAFANGTNRRWKILRSTVAGIGRHWKRGWRHDRNAVELTRFQDQHIELV